MNRKLLNQFLIVTLLITFINICLGYNALELILNSLIFLTIGIIGTKLALQINIPIWLKINRKSLPNIIILSLLVIIVNTIPWLQVNEEVITSIPWMSSMTNVSQAVLIALRTGISEEVFYRFFLFSTIIWIIDVLLHFLNKDINRMKIALLSGIIVSVIFTFQHPTFLLPFFLGAILNYIYFRAGLLPAICTHFLADVIPFIIVITKFS